MINPFGFLITVIGFKIADKYKNYRVLKHFPPMLIASIFIILILKIFNIPYETYKESASFLTFLLIPATVALGFPLYKNANLLIKNKRIIYFAFLTAVIIALLTTYFTAKFLNTEGSIIISMLPKSVTAPIAVEISKNIGGMPELTACFVAMTGVFGALVGHKILKFIKIKNDIAIGLAIGAASHVIGTSRCLEEGNEKQVVMSTLALVIVGIITAFAAPILIFILK